MVIQVNSVLIKSREPNEHGLSIKERHGRIIHVTGDGYNLIEFFKLMIKKKKNILTPEGKKKSIYVEERLQWYVHDLDLSIAEKQSKAI